MNDPRHDRLRRLFDEAMDLPALDRPAFVDAKCRGDATMLRRLRGMLAAAVETDFLASPTGADAGATTAGPAAAGVADAEALLHEGPGTRIGPYKLLQQIGEGGFGVVFMAEQEQPVVRRVALKVIKLGMDTRQVVARFEQERQALAMMDHPNIAKVLDAGATATGRPYFVMELCKGEPIVAYCDANNLTINERLELMAQVCLAVQHAHGKGVIHRDLKPSNILVGTQDGKPSAKVIDFGIAKATSQKLTDKTLFTEHQQVIGTLQYMSPEQAEGSLDIDTRSDVYSLGVLLYELLTGSTPFDKQTLRNAMYSEIQRMIREVEPHRPSTRLSDSHESLASIAAHRRVTPNRLGTLVRGELDWIVMKALEKDRRRRYETANGLANDLRRFLRGEAVLAAPPSSAYRLRKFAQRNRGAVAAGLAVAAALLVGVVGFAWQARVAAVERDRAVAAQHAEAAQRVVAERNQSTADGINRFLLEMLGAADIRQLGRDAKVAEALDRAAATVGTAFPQRPEVEAAVRRILGRTYLSLGMLDAAGPQIEAALALHRQVQGEQSIEYAWALSGQGAWLGARGDDAAAATVHRRSVELTEELLGPDDQETLVMRTNLANTLARLGQLAEAEAMLRQLLADRTRVSGRAAVSTQVLLNSLAVLLHGQQRLDEAESLYREAVELGMKDPGPEHPDVLTVRMNLASLLRSRDRLSEAEPQMVAVCADMRRVFGAAHGQTAKAVKVLGELYAAQGRFRDALPLFEECVAALLPSEGEGSQGVLEAKQSLAMACKRLGEMPRALLLLREVAAGNAALHGAESSQALNADLNVANSLGAAEASEAEAIFKNVLEVSPRALGETSQVHIIANNSYGVFLMAKDRYADAKPYVQKALELGEAAEGKEHKNTLITRYNLSGIYRESGDLAGAEVLGRQCVESFLRVFGPRHPNSASAHTSLGRTLVLLGQPEPAEREFAAAVAICKASLGPQNPGFCDHALQLARLLADGDRADEAEAVLRDTVAVLTKASGEQDRRTALHSVELGHSLALQERFAEAEPLLLGGHATLVLKSSAAHADVRRAERYLAACYADWQRVSPSAERAEQAAAWQAKVAAPR